MKIYLTETTNEIQCTFSSYTFFLYIIITSLIKYILINRYSLEENVYTVTYQCNCTDPN